MTAAAPAPAAEQACPPTGPARRAATPAARTNTSRTREPATPSPLFLLNASVHTQRRRKPPPALPAYACTSMRTCSTSTSIRQGSLRSSCTRSPAFSARSASTCALSSDTTSARADSVCGTHTTLRVWAPAATRPVLVLCCPDGSRHCSSGTGPQQPSRLPAGPWLPAGALAHARRPCPARTPPAPLPLSAPRLRARALRSTRALRRMQCPAQFWQASGGCRRRACRRRPAAAPATGTRPPGAAHPPWWLAGH
jgi:hypothetical protein